LGSFIISIAEYLWIACLLTLVISLLVPVVQSSRATAVIWVVMGLIMDRVAPELMALSAWDAEIGRHAWYFAWVLFNTLTVLLIFYVHNRLAWQYSKLSQYIALCCVAMVILQTARFMDRLIFKTDVLASFYKYGVPSLNIAVVSAIVLWLFTSIVTMKKGI
jgi:hypothetical protein